MPFLNRRSFLKIMGATAVTAAAPVLMTKTAQGFSSSNSMTMSHGMPAGFYDVPMKGNVRILHITDVHGQLNPVYFR